MRETLAAHGLDGAFSDLFEIDKEEIGSDGVTGMQSMYVFHFMQLLCRAAGQDDIAKDAQFINSITIHELMKEYGLSLIHIYVYKRQQQKLRVVFKKRKHVLGAGRVFADLQQLPRLLFKIVPLFERIKPVHLVCFLLFP